MDPNEIVSAMSGQVVKDDWETGQEISSGWFKFDEIGKFIKGTLIGKRFQPANDKIPTDQWIYELQTPTGVMKVGIKHRKDGPNYVNDRMKYIQFGQIVGFKYEKNVEGKFAGKPAKSIQVKSWGMDPNYTAEKDFTSNDDIDVDNIAM